MGYGAQAVAAVATAQCTGSVDCAVDVSNGPTERVALQVCVSDGGELSQRHALWDDARVFHICQAVLTHAPEARKCAPVVDGDRCVCSTAALAANQAGQEAIYRAALHRIAHRERRCAVALGCVEQHVSLTVGDHGRVALEPLVCCSLVHVPCVYLTLHERLDHVGRVLHQSGGACEYDRRLLCLHVPVDDVLLLPL